MIIKTKYFDKVEINEKEIIHFPEAIYGFPNDCDFILLAFEEDNDNLLCMQSINKPSLAFILMNPFIVVNDYSPKITDDDIVSINGNPKEDNEFLFYSLTVIYEDASITINLRNPIVINPKYHCAKQVMLDNDKYSMRHNVNLTSR